MFQFCSHKTSPKIPGEKSCGIAEKTSGKYGRIATIDDLFGVAAPRFTRLPLAGKTHDKSSASSRVTSS